MSDSNDDQDLFRRTINIDKKLEFDGIKPTRKKLKIISRQDRSFAFDEDVVDQMFSEDYQPANLEMGDELLFFQPGVSRAVFSKLRKGKIDIQAQLDLHGMTVTMARERLACFLLECKHVGKRCVRIIHGKGRGSVHGQPVIKNKVNIWLRQTDYVLAFCSARQIDGGTGAIYVLLKRS